MKKLTLFLFFFVVGCSENNTGIKQIENCADDIYYHQFLSETHTPLEEFSINAEILYSEENNLDVVINEINDLFYDEALKKIIILEEKRAKRLENTWVLITKDGRTIKSLLESGDREMLAVSKEDWNSYIIFQRKAKKLLKRNSPKEKLLELEGYESNFKWCEERRREYPKLFDAKWEE